MLDEAEYISFISPLDVHWKKDYLEFWQTLWSAQSQVKCLSLIIAGVNASIVETDLVDGVQNPLFGIVPHKYLTGFNNDECRTMLKKLGRRMGIDFNSETCEVIRGWYGGHPLLVRQACSTLNSFLSKKEERPFFITLDVFDKHKELIDTELTFYSDHAISEIKLFYPDEYLMFELLSTGQELDFNEYSKETQYLKHLINYQLIRRAVDNSGYTPNIPVIAQRVAHESRSKDNRGLIYPIIDSSVRHPWLIRRIDEISNDFSVLKKIVSTGKTISLFGSNSFPEGVELKSTCVVSNKQTFISFINTINRCFV